MIVHLWLQRVWKTSNPFIPTCAMWADAYFPLQPAYLFPGVVYSLPPKPFLLALGSSCQHSIAPGPKITCMYFDTMFLVASLSFFGPFAPSLHGHCCFLFILYEMQTFVCVLQLVAVLAHTYLQISFITLTPIFSELSGPLRIISFSFLVVFKAHR